MFGSRSFGLLLVYWLLLFGVFGGIGGWHDDTLGAACAVFVADVGADGAADREWGDVVVELGAVGIGV